MKKHWQLLVYVVCLLLAVWGIYGGVQRGSMFSVGLNCFSLGLNTGFIFTYPILRGQRDLIKDIMASWRETLDILDEIRLRSKRG